MKYALLISTTEKDDLHEGDPGWEPFHAGYAKFTQQLVEAGQVRGGERLQPATTATTVRIRNGQRLVTDGPFVDTHEQLGGFYIVECKDRDEAVAIAARIPGAATNSVEVRPIMEM